jgi:hypothetical protein
VREGVGGGFIVDVFEEERKKHLCPLYEGMLGR